MPPSAPRPPSLPPEARAAVLAWFDANGRSIAFRRTRDPYAVLVSEVMAQQTQIARVAPAWERFLARFPTVGALADASPADVLRAWRGMGYNRRALNLVRAAQAMRDEHGGTVPDELAALERLPGIGPYTARAVAAIAFGQPVSGVDTNVRRVVSRSLAIEPTSRELQAAADASVEPTRPGDWTHALMDIGATLCRPTGPRCDACPLRGWCQDVARGDVRRPAAPARRAGVPFESTSRWLRGRILDVLRSAPDGAWTSIEAPVGRHELRAVQTALEALARDGLVEIDPRRRRRARLATA